MYASLLSHKRINLKFGWIIILLLSAPSATLQNLFPPTRFNKKKISIKFTDNVILIQHIIK